MSISQKMLKNYSCEKCGQKFARLGFLQDHLIQAHPDQATFTVEAFENFIVDEELIDVVGVIDSGSGTAF